MTCLRERPNVPVGSPHLDRGLVHIDEVVGLLGPLDAAVLCALQRLQGHDTAAG